jgi:hypothetical protein
MTAVTRTNIFSVPFDNLFTVLNNRSNIADPRDATGTRKFVYDAEPFVKAIDFSAFPYIVLKQPILSMDQASADSRHKWLRYRHQLLIRTAKLGSGGSRSDAGHADMQVIIDDVLETFNSVMVLSGLRSQGMFHLKAEVVAYDDIGTESQQAIYESTIEITYDFRQLVSA